MATKEKSKPKTSVKKTTAGKTTTTTKTTKRKATAGTAEKRKTKPRKKPVAASAKSSPQVLTEEQRTEMVRTAAYYLSMKRGDEAGSELEDWIQAEKEIESGFSSERA